MYPQHQQKSIMKVIKAKPKNITGHGGLLDICTRLLVHTQQKVE